MTWFVIAMSCAFMSAIAAVLQKKVLFRIQAWEFSFLLSVAVIPLSAVFLFWTNVLIISPETLGIITGKSVLGAAAFLLVMMSLEHNQISQALPLLALTPAVTALTSLLLMGESMKVWEWGGLVLMIAGTYLVERRGHEASETAPHLFGQGRGKLWIVAALLLFAISSILDKVLVSGMKADPWTVLFYQHFVYALIFGGFLWIRGASMRPMFSLGREHLVLLLAIAGLTIGYRYLQLEATRAAPVALVLAVKRTSVLYASFFGGRLFSDVRLTQRLVGAALIVASGFVLLRNVS